MGFTGSIKAFRGSKKRSAPQAPPSSAAPGTPQRVLAVDPALRCTGYAVVERQAAGPKAIAWGTIVNPPSRLQSACLAAIRSELAALIEQHHPTVCAVEGIIFVQSFRTAITLGAARGAALVAAAEAGLRVFEYAPRRVKQAIVGTGAAQKGQVAFMVRARLLLTETPQADAADALAIALTHLQSEGSVAGLAGTLDEV